MVEDSTYTTQNSLEMQYSITILQLREEEGFMHQVAHYF